MEVPLTPPAESVRPWRTATIVATGIAAVELVLLIVAGGMLLAKPVSRAVADRAKKAALTPSKTEQKAPAAQAKQKEAPPKLARGKTEVLVLNGNGRTGAAAGAADELRDLGYRIAGTANAARQDYATSVVMYRPGFRSEAVRLARDLEIDVVGPLDGLKPSALHGGQLAVILGN